MNDTQSELKRSNTPSEAESVTVNKQCAVCQKQKVCRFYNDIKDIYHETFSVVCSEFLKPKTPTGYSLWD